MLENMFALNKILATGTLVLEIALAYHVIVYLIFCFSSDEIKSKLKHALMFFKKEKMEKYLLVSIFLLSLISSVMTLVYSEYFLQVPCALCWFQRVFMYGIVVISGTAIYSRRELEQRGILKYILNFSILGLLVALYQHIEQILPLFGKSIPCPASGGDCAKMTLFEYSHITFPWMAVIIFSIFIIHILIAKKMK